MPSPIPIEINGSRLKERVAQVFADIGTNTLRTSQIVTALDDVTPSAVRVCLTRMGTRGELESPLHGFWRLPLPHGRSAYRAPRPRAEIVLPNTTTEDLQVWAANVLSENPISVGSGPYSPGLELEVEQRLFMGIELTFRSGERKVFTLALFSDSPTAEEEAKMMEVDQ